MDSIKKIVKMLLIIFFPIGILYCLLHTLGKDFICFLGALFIFGIGILVGIYIISPETIQQWIGVVQNFFHR